MGKCDFFVLPSFHESFGTVYIEAMACGKPVIGTSSGGTPEIASIYGVPLPDVISKESLQVTLDKIKSNYEFLYSRIESDMSNFSINNVAEQYLKVFEKVLNED